MSLIIKFIFLVTFSTCFVWAQDPLKADAQRLWQKRDVKESLSQAIQKFEQLHKANPSDQEILLSLIRSNFIMGDFHTKDKDQKLKILEKAFHYGDQALALNAEYSQRLKKGNDIEEAVKALTMKEVPLMFWTAASIGKYARTKGIFASIKFKGKILALISRVEELEPAYFYGAVNRYWGGYFAVIPGIAGKDLKKSKQNFEKSLQLAPEYLGTKVLMAETYFVEKDDEKDFKKILNEVVQDTKSENHPELGPENRLEKIKAKKLLENVDEYF
jgi:tetratricopeptide (TPR) repeat protein